MARSAADLLGRDFPSGATLFEEGDPGSRMYVIQKGAVRIVKRIGDHPITLAVLRSGDFFGEMALLERQPRSATAVVDEAATIVEVDEDQFAKLLATSSDITYKLLRRLSSRVRDADRQIQNFLASDGLARAVEVLRALAGAPGKDGWRTLPRDFGEEALAIRAGVPIADAEAFSDRLRRPGVLRARDACFELAPAEVVADFLRFLDLKSKYDPLTAGTLAEMAGMSEEEVHRILKKVLYAKLLPTGAVDGGKALYDAYGEYVTLKGRFEPTR
jgi:CRP-like cAMP-binding protein